MLQRALRILERRSHLFFLLLLLIGSFRIVSTYSVFGATYDEPFHLGRGMEWLDLGTYKLSHENPPLSGILVAIGPRLAGARSVLARQESSTPDPFREGYAILGSGEQYDRLLTFARLGVLPCYWLALWVVYVATLRLSSRVPALLAVLFLSNLPPVLAHASVATTDMPLTAFLSLSVLAGVWWLNRPNRGRSILFGVTVAFALQSKMSAIPFLAVTLFSMFAWYIAAFSKTPATWVAAGRSYVWPAIIATFSTLLVLWAGYRFSLGPSVSFPHVWIPMKEFFGGIVEVSRHNLRQQPSYLLGVCAKGGFRMFYPVSFVLKTPIGFLILLGGAVAFLLVQWRRTDLALPICFSLSIFLFSILASRINIGVRHILPVYMGFSMAAAIAAFELLKKPARTVYPWAAIASIVWFLLSSALSDPDHLAYMNEFAYGSRDRYLVDSDLDWGQDERRLANRLHELGVADVIFTPFAESLVLAGRPEIHVHPTDYAKPAPGWNAATVSYLDLSCRGRPVAPHPWPKSIAPQERIGKTISLYYFPPESTVNGKAAFR